MKFSEITGTVEQIDCLLSRHAWATPRKSVNPPRGYEFTGRIIDLREVNCPNILVSDGDDKVYSVGDVSTFGVCNMPFFLEVKPVEKKYRYICDENPRYLTCGDWYKSSISLGFSAEFCVWASDKPSTFKDFPFRREEISE